MVQTVTMPKLGQTVEEATIVKWHAKTGNKVAKGDILFEIETDKAVLEVESFFNGTLLKILANDGETVPVMSAVAFVGRPGDALPDVAPPPKGGAPKPAQRQASHSPAPPDSAPGRAAAGKTGPSADPPPEPTAAGRKAVSPRARALARECAVGTDPIPGSGPDGRVVERDVRRYLAERDYDSIRITPAAKTLAARENVDILEIDSRGERITVDRVREALAERPQALGRLRRLIAERMTHSFTTTPHFFVTVSVDMTDLLALRKALKQRGQSYSVTDFVLKGVAMALTRFPALNSSSDGETVRRNSRVHLGMAVAVKDGLVVPVIRDAHEISLAELHEVASDLADKARAGKLAPDEMTGGTFTISNMGMLNVENFTAIINPGESAILAIASTKQQPVAVGKRVAIRSMMKMTLSSDHRIVDGSMAAGFINQVKKLIEDTELWKNSTSP